MAERHPRDLSGGERQRLALAIVAADAGEARANGGRTDGRSPPGAPTSAPSTAPTLAPAVLALDEPTRGMDRQVKAELADELRRRAARGQAVIVATHDPEFAAACADRAVLLAEGRVIADGPAPELLAAAGTSPPRQPASSVAPAAP